ncbi:MAG: metallophosphoesterase, partial [Bacteroidota bacterium]
MPISQRQHFFCCLLFIGIFSLYSCSSSQLYVDEDRIPDEIQPPEQESVYTVFLIGDSGAPQLETKDPVLTLFEHFLEQANKNSAALFLGDNLYPAGLPDSSDPDRSYYEDRLKAQLNTVQNFKGKVIMVPGNHDWHDGGPEGLQRVREQERFVEEYLDRGNTFLPDDGFPGPVDLKLADEDKTGLPGDIRLLAIDTQWWLHGHEKPFGDTGEYDLHDGGDFLTEFDDLLKKRRKDFLIVAGHHPLITHDNHGGFLPPDIHWKPPVFGSLYALYRRVFGLPQDVNHHKYRQLSERLQEMMMLNDHLIYTSGHSHNLQYHVLRHPRTTQHFLVSGAGSKESYVAPGRGADFTYAGKGFMVLKFFKDGSIWMEAWAPDAESDRGKKLSVHLVKPATQEVLPPQEEQITSEISYQDSTYRTAARKDYDEKSWIFEALAGSHNRKYWSIETEFPVFDISTQKGGLVVDRLGGRGQSQTLHLKDKEGNKYVLRSVDKVAGKVWDEQLRNTIALDLVQDQFSIINPYAALVVPGLANAAGVFHTNPEVFYIPHDPRLGVYTDLVGGQLALFEEKPDGDMRHVESVGRSKKVLSHRQMIRAIEGDIDHRVVQEDFARARLFDMLISDWDRHFDQWRWASFEPEDKKGKLYRPIPRDRDVALMVMNGIGPTLAKWGPFYQYQNYDESYGNLRGMNANSIGLTRRFTNTLTRDEW